MFDFIIFGASGFTGRYVVEAVVKTLKTSNDKFTYAVAGRSKEKLAGTLKEVSDVTGADLSTVPIIIADNSNYSDLVKMAKQGKAVLNCAGPYRFSGRQVVNACIEAGTHYLDLSAEKDYLAEIQRDCDKAAKEKGVYIVGSCGFDSVPADLGTVYLTKNFGGDVNSVEEFIEMENKGSKSTKIHYGTWASIIHGIANAKKVEPVMKALFDMEPKPPKPRHELKQRSPLHNSKVVNGWCVPFTGSDRTVVLRSQHLLYGIRNERPVQTHAYVKVGSFLSSLWLLLAGLFLGILVYLPFKLGQNLLLNYPKVMSFGYVTHEGPTREEMDSVEFTVTLSGEGWSEKLANPGDQHVEKPNKKKIVKVSGTNPGYSATCIIMIQCGLTILREGVKMPNKGGVYPPGAAFSETDLISRLKNNGIKFEILNT